MRIAILQPGYLPWLGFFEQIHKSDVFVLYDDVQYDKHGWRNRNRIKTANGVQWLTVPVHAKQGQLIYDVEIDNTTNWQKKHYNTLTQSYSKAPYFERYMYLLEDIYNDVEWHTINELNDFLIFALIDCLGLNDKRIVYSSRLNIPGDRLERLLGICKYFGANVFYEGASGRNYIDEQYFKSHGITVEYQDYKHPTYNQLYGEFVPYLSVVDLLFNHGEDSLKILTEATHLTNY